MLAKVIYFNWYKGDAEGLMRPTFSGELLAERPDLYDVVGEMEADPSEDGCETVFRAFNRVEEGDMEGLTIRSMSTGDIVLFDNSKMFVVLPTGWKEIPAGIDKLAFWGRPLVKNQLNSWLGKE